MAFKMKGSPMKRNFNVGGSPAKHRVGKFMHDSAHDGNHPTADTFINDKHETEFTKKKDKEVKDKETKSPAELKSALKQKEKTVEVREGDRYKNKRGETQEEVLEKQKKKATDYSKKAEDYIEDNKDSKSINDDIKLINANLDKLNQNLINSMDSIHNVNTNFDIQDKKKRSESGLFQKTSKKEVEDKQKSDKKYMEDLDKKRKKKAEDEIKRIQDEYINSMNTSVDSLNTVNKNYVTQQQKDYLNMSAAEYAKKYGNK